jgi:hypothetical protein
MIAIVPRDPVSRNSPKNRIQHHPLFFAARRGEAAQTVFIEAERFFDARRLASIVFADPDPLLTTELRAVPKHPLPRWQIRWTGSAASNPSTLRMETRFLVSEEQQGGWREA